MWPVQIRLSPKNTGKLKDLVKVYEQTCPDYNLSATQQVNLLLAGRLGLALVEAQAELKKNKRCRRK